MTPDESARIDAWVAEQMRQPWPLSADQYATVRRALGGPVDRESPGDMPTGSDRVA